MDCGFETFGLAAPAGFQPALLDQAGFAPVIAGRRARIAQARRAAQIRCYVAENLDNPELCARDCARELGMSVRSLYLALESAGVAFSALVVQARLARCRALLAQRGGPRNMADLAFASGFNSLSSFYRAFRREFGGCPAELRAQGF